MSIAHSSPDSLPSVVPYGTTNARGLQALQVGNLVTLDGFSYQRVEPWPNSRSFAEDRMLNEMFDVRNH